MKRTLERAVDVARKRGDSAVAPEHVLLAILNDTGGIAGAAIRRLGYDGAIRDEVTRRLADARGQEAGR